MAEFRRSEVDMGAIRAWFDKLWYNDEEGDGKWNPTKPVEVTDAALDLASATMTGTQIVAQDMLEEILAMDGKWGAVHPDLKKRSSQTFGHLMALVKAKGGTVGQKLVKEEGVQRYYTVYDLSGKLETARMSNGGQKILVESAETKVRAMKLAEVFAKVNELVSGKG